MEGKEANRLQDTANRAEQDEGHSKEYLSVKLNVMSVALHNIECSHLPPEPDDPDEEDRHRWVPFPCGSFVDACIEAFYLSGGEVKAKKFLDIGCGIGTKVMLADVLFDAHGLELNEEYLRVADLIGCRNVWQADAMEYVEYGDYDILYFYAPFREDILQNRFERHVYQHMSPGTILIPMHTMTMWSTRWPDMKKVGSFCFQKE
tara:strand:+ start:443 stop:1054 length:612 start_codon:yes stop_codon:yes gene_type:complete